MRKRRRATKRFPLPSQLDQDQFQRQFQSTLDSEDAKAPGWSADYRKLTLSVGVNPRFLQSRLYHIVTATGIERKRFSLRRLAERMKTVANRLTQEADEIADLNRSCLIMHVPPEALLDADSAGPRDERVTRRDALLARHLPGDLAAYAQLLNRLVPNYRRHASLKRYGSDDYALAQLDSYVKQLTTPRPHPRDPHKEVAHPYMHEVANLISAAATTLGKHVNCEANSLARKIDRFRGDERNRDLVQKIDQDVARYIAEGNDGWPIPGRTARKSR